MRIGLFTNGAYDIFGVIIFRRLFGICTYSKYSQVKEKGALVDWPEYHLSEDSKPQFYRKKML